jgi:predicted DNA-binding ribbon-helix-helix protein
VSDIVKRSVVIDGHRTSVSLEPAFWEALKEIAERRSLSINKLIAEIDRGRTGNLSSAIRVYVLRTVRGQQPQQPEEAGRG